jgi:hypothetical protein
MSARKLKWGDWCGKDSGDPMTEITKQRRRLLVHRYLYYVLASPIITDYQYDMWEKQLEALVAAHPDVAERLSKYERECPLKSPGSSRVEDYPDEVIALAESLADYHPPQK